MKIDTLLVVDMKRTPEFRTFNGRAPSAYLDMCKSLDSVAGAKLIYTRDVDMHESGWFKNPDYDRCYHPSLSFGHKLTNELMS